MKWTKEEARLKLLGKEWYSSRTGVKQTTPVKYEK